MSVAVPDEHRRPARDRPPAALVIAGVVVAALSLAPVGYVLGHGGANLDRLRAVLSAPTTGTLLLHTVLLAVLVPVTSAVVGIGLAVLVVRTTLPARRVFAVLFVLPLGIPAFVSSFAWVAASYRVLPRSTALFGLGGAVLVLTLALFPYVYLPVVAVLRGLDPAQEEAARALGHGPFSAFRRVTLPQLKLAVAGGTLIIGLHMLAEYGALVLLRYQTLTTAIVARYELGSSEEALALSTLLSVLCLLLLLADQAWRRRATPTRLGSGAARVPVRWQLSWRSRPAVLAGALLVVAASLLVPLFGILDGLVAQLRRGGWSASDWTALGAAVGATARYGVAAAIVATVVGLPVSFLAVRHRGAVATVVERVTWIAHSLPGVVIALALVSLAVHYVYPLYQTSVVLVAGYVVMFLPIALGAQQAGLGQAARHFDEMSHALGRGPLRTFLTVTLPIALPGVASGAMLVLLNAGKELTATLLLHPTGVDTLATGLWQKTALLDFGGAAPYAIGLLVVGAIPAALLARRIA